MRDSWRQVGRLTGKVLEGANPADLPIEQPAKFELVINMKTARALGLTVPPSTLAGHRMMPTKSVQLLKEVPPRVAPVAMLFNPASAPYAKFYLEPLKTSAPSLGIEAVAMPVHDTSEMESLLAAQAAVPDIGIFTRPDPFPNIHRSEIIGLAARYRPPAVYPFRPFAEAGGLLWYGNDQLDDWRRAAGYVDRILRGAKPSELPIQAPVKFELIINIKTARELGLKIPPTILAESDGVIE